MKKHIIKSLHLTLYANFCGQEGGPLNLGAQGIEVLLNIPT